VIGLAVSGQFLMTASGQIPMSANSPGIDFRDSGIFVVVGRLSANRWAQYPQGCPVSCGGQDQPMAGFARISVILVTALPSPAAMLSFGAEAAPGLALAYRLGCYHLTSSVVFMLVRRGLRRSRVTLTDTIFAGCPGPAAPMGRGQLHETGRAGTSVTGPRGSRVPALATTA